MRARTTTVFGLILLLGAAPVDASTSMPAPKAALRIFVGTTSLRSPAHRSLSIQHGIPPGPAAAAESRAFLAALLPLFGPDLLDSFGGTALIATYVPGATLGKLRPIAIGSGELLAWSPYGAPPGRDILDQLMARQPVQALVPGEDGIQRADLRIAIGERVGAEGVLVTNLNLRGRNAPDENMGIDPPALAVVGLGLVCLAPASRRVRPSARLQPMRRLRFHRR